jgi:hypothetical protein
MANRRQLIRQIAAFGLAAGLLMGFAAACIAQAAAGANIPQLPELNGEQRSDWLNVRSAAQMADIGPAVVGDGVADDTVALQAALNEIHGKQGGSPFSTVYLPPGTCRITRELYPTGGYGVLRVRVAYSDEIGHGFRLYPDRIPADAGQRPGGSGQG